MRDKGVRFMPIWGRQAYKIDGKFKFWGGLTVEAWGGGPGLVEAWTRIARKNNVQVAYGARALSLIADDDGVKGVRIKYGGKTVQVQAKCVVLAAGGFEANTEWRTRYLGPAGSSPRSGAPASTPATASRWRSTSAPWRPAIGRAAHAVGWDRNAPEFGDLAVGDNFQKHSFPWGIMVNADGGRFVDEGADFRNYTYAKYGRVILMQPKQFAWQVFDTKIIPMLRDEYRIKRVTKVRAETLEEFCRKLEDVDAEKALSTIKAYNKAVMTEVPFDPNVKDGRGTRGLAVPKSNWANTIDEPPFEAYEVTCGITFTFGGLQDRHRPRGSSTPTASRSPACLPPASWSAACSISIIPAAPG